MSSPKAKFPARLREARKAKSLSQDAAAHAAGVTWITWQRWEAGSISPTDEHLHAAAKVLGVTAMWLEYGH